MIGFIALMYICITIGFFSITVCEERLTRHDWHKKVIFLFVVSLFWPIVMLLQNFNIVGEVKFPDKH